MNFTANNLLKLNFTSALSATPAFEVPSEPCLTLELVSREMTFELSSITKQVLILAVHIGWYVAGTDFSNFAFLGLLCSLGVEILKDYI